MPISGIITFIAGTKAKANEVNNNFNIFKAFVDGLETLVATNTVDIANLNNNKANVNGDPTKRFAMADAVNNTDGINKQTLTARTVNILPYINGLAITKSTANTINVASGSCYDSGYAQPMVLTNPTQKQNTTQSASTTYYIHLIAKANGLSVDVLISTTQVAPPLPADYIFYRNIGSYTTNSSNVIDIITLTGSPATYELLMPNYTGGVSQSFGTTYTAEKAGWVRVGAYVTSGNHWYFSVNGVTLQDFTVNDANGSSYDVYPISKGDSYIASGGQSSQVLTFYPTKGAV